MTKLEKQVEALRTRLGTCRIEDFKEVQAEFFRVQKLAAEQKRAGGRLKLVRVYEESEVEEVSVGEYRLKNRRR